MRKYPQQFSKSLVKVLESISIHSPNVVGGSADYRLLYSSDYDMIEEVSLTDKSDIVFMNRIRDAKGTIVDIKCGNIPQWDLLTSAYIHKQEVKNYNQEQEINHITQLYHEKIITRTEYEHGLGLLKKNLKPIELLYAKKELRFGLLRWTKQEVLANRKLLRDGNTIDLKTAFMSGSPTKVDLVAWVDNRYTEVSNIIVWKGYTETIDPIQSLKDDIFLFWYEKNYIKMVKRMLSLAKQMGWKNDIDKFLGILNSPIALVYTILNDLELIKEHRDIMTPKKVRKQLDLMKEKVSKLYFDKLKGAVPSLKLIDLLKKTIFEESYTLLTNLTILPLKDKFVK